MPDPTKVAGAQVAVTATVDVKILSDLTALTQELQKQILSLQSDAIAEGRFRLLLRDKFELLQKDVSDKVSEQSNKFELLQRDVSELTFDRKNSEASAAMVKDIVPDKYGALRPKMVNTESRIDRIKSCLSPSRSRSPSPKKGLRPVFKDADEMQSYVSTSDPPSRNVSPTRRIEKRLAKAETKLLGDMTNLVDAQVQNLELRIETMETQFGNWRQASVPDDNVQGLSSMDLQMLSGLKVVKSRNCMTLGCQGCQGCRNVRAPVSAGQDDDPSPCSSSSGDNEEQGKRAKKEKKASRWNLWFLKSKQKVNQATRPNAA